jgi:hypothetical protein
MPSSEMRRCVDLVKTDVSEQRVASIFRVETIHERRKALHTHVSSWVGVVSPLKLGVPSGLNLAPQQNLKNRVFNRFPHQIFI